MSSARRRGAGARMWQERSLRVLVDMDGVLCDFEGSFLQMFKEKYPNSPHIPLEERKTFYVADQYGDFSEEIAVCICNNFNSLNIL